MSESLNGLTARIDVPRSEFTIDVDLDVPFGSTTALLGPNGAGKSSILTTIAGLADIADDAEVRVVVDGRVLTDTSAGTWVPPDQRRVGIVFQEHRLFDHLSVLDNVAFGPRSAGARSSAARRAATQWIDLLDLGALVKRRPHELSGGEAQRVAIARTLAAEPHVLLLDEPLAALDVTTRSEIRRVLRDQLRAFPGPRLLVTHDPSDAFLLADRLLVIESGRITQAGTPDEIRHSPATPYVAALTGTNLYVGRADDGSVELADHDHRFTITDHTLAGAVMLTVHPNAVSLHPAQPTGSQRNTWAAVVEIVEPLGDTVRVTLGGPVPIAVDVTPEAVAALGLRPDEPVWAAVKATEISVSPA
ncbi:sulfate/molybdate ABC transporter ATP-binding protein [Ilumatobacter nonamiensis]|uniref:sulfate/molybdate ABC transporter ATP-binding protein n=1 Tax=Ilumatobacter nonamiensis TaxID=467093 RepID=UPI00068718A3|nr:ATP-binding cassette domain-containing protein [Ilumatobacter nonamiensis]